MFAVSSCVNVIRALGQRIKISGGVAGTALHVNDEASHLLDEPGSIHARFPATSMTSPFLPKNAGYCCRRGCSGRNHIMAGVCVCFPPTASLRDG
jgi:hypothetical protein